MEARVDINRRHDYEEERNNIEFVIKLDVGREITVVMNAEDFVMALTGRSEPPAKVTTRNVEITVEGRKPKIAKVK